jgi:hypothetical protein
MAMPASNEIASAFNALSTMITVAELACSIAVIRMPVIEK